MTSKQPWRANLTSYLKFVGQITFAVMFVWTVLALFGPNDGNKERRNKEHLPLLELSASPQRKTPMVTMWCLLTVARLSSQSLLCKQRHLLMFSPQRGLPMYHLVGLHYPVIMSLRLAVCKHFFGSSPSPLT